MNMLNHFNLLKKIKNIFFPFYKNKEIRFVFNKLQENLPDDPKTAMFVGGCVRKYLKNENIEDIDIATILTTDQIKERIQGPKFRIIDSGIKHGTVTIISQNLKLELTTLRKDVTTDGRHAEIEYTNNWQKDSERRDFTINAIYLDINGKIFDPQLGTEDLKNSVVKFIGNPQKRIEEDYLRIIRFMRFSLEYGSKAEQNTIEAIKLNLDGIKNLSKERMFNELSKIIKLKNFFFLNENKDLKEIFLLVFPELVNLNNLDKIKRLYNKELFNYKILFVILLIDDTNNHEYFAHKYKISNNLKEFINLLVTNYKILKANKKFFKEDLKKNVYFFGKKHLKELNLIHLALSKNSKMSDYLRTLKEINKVTIPKFSLDGNYLKNKGLNEGILIGKTLKLLEEEWINDGFKISNDKIEKIIERQKN